VPYHKELVGAELLIAAPSTCLRSCTVGGIIALSFIVNEGPAGSSSVGQPVEDRRAASVE
jgi:hypothetical protein